MPAIENNLVNSVDIAALPAQIEEVLSQNPRVIVENIADGWGHIRETFIVDESDDRTPLLSMEVRDILQPAKDEFDPTPDAVKIGAKLPTFHDIDIDLSLKRSDILAIYRSYGRFVAGLTSQQEVLANPWPAFFLGEILRKAGRDLAYRSAYLGVRNAAQKGALASLDGLVLKHTQGRASGDIPAANIYDSTTDGAGFDADAYDEINEIAQLTEGNPDLIGMPMSIRMSPRTYRLYREARRAASPNLVSLAEQPTTLDDFPNIAIQIEEGLGGRRYSYITLTRGNEFFTFNQNFSNWNLKMIEQVKGWQFNTMFSAGVDYGLGKLLFSNDRND